MGTTQSPTLPTEQETPWEPDYSPWRHGGWYTNARYPSGACGCVSNNYDDKKWRIACGSYHGLTFSTRRDAANAERAMTLAMCAADAAQSTLLAACKTVLAVLDGSSPRPTVAMMADLEMIVRAAITKAEAQ